MSNIPSADAKAVVKAADALTTQVRRIADALTTPVVEVTDDEQTTLLRCPLCPIAVPFSNPQQAIDHFRAQHPEQRLNTSGPWPLLVPDDGPTTPATTCSAQYTGPDNPRTECIRAGQHEHPFHTNASGWNWREDVAVYPLADSTVTITHWLPMSEQCAEEQRELAGQVSEFIDAQLPHARRRPAMDPVHILGIDAPADDTSGPAVCRRMETRTCPEPYNGPCGGRPCARFESDDPTPWLDTAASPTADEEKTLRWTRRESLLVLLTRLQRGRALTEEEAATLRHHVETEIREADTARSVAAGNKRHVQVMYEELNKLADEHKAADSIRAEAQSDRDQHAAVLREVLGRFTIEADLNGPHVCTSYVPVEVMQQWRSVVAPTVERPWWEQVALYEKEAVEATKHVLELKAAIERVREVKKSPKRSPHNTYANAQDDGWDQALDAVRAALDGPTETEE